MGVGQFSAGMNRFRDFPKNLRQFGIRARIFLFLLCLLSTNCVFAQGPWTVVGPDGGDARAFAAVPGQPGHLYLGTTNSWLYESLDQGASWHRLAKLDKADGFVLDSIVVDLSDPRTIFVGAWKNSDDGGVWISHDSGRTWSEPQDLKGQSIHALVQAPSDPNTLIAGTLLGVYRSTDRGATWTLISPAGSKEIHEVESLAVDPSNQDVIYAGTWHLPWKTTDGGKSWKSIKQGLIVDSDVFSIVVDPEHTRTVYLSACSGIYKSENAGALFHKIQGIPNEARRTRVLMQDPENLQVVYAGTTEGLYKTENAGKTFKRMTDPDVIVNDVYVDPKDANHVILATDRSGVLASMDAGVTFTESNQGISERKVAALLVDRSDPERLYAGVVNDKNFGGVFRSGDGGAHWEHLNAGLDGRDVFALDETKDGTVVAGTSHGIFALGAANSGDPPAASGDSLPATAAGAEPPASATATWQPRNTIANTVVKTVTETHYRTHVNVEKQVKAPVIELESLVHALDVSGDVWIAATSYGLLTSRDQGATWQGGPVMGGGEYLSVTVDGDNMAAARGDSVVASKDAGQTWWPMGLPTMLTRIHSVVFAPDGALWLGAREGVYFTRDMGKTWMWIQRLPFRDVDDLSYDAAMKKMLASSRSSDQVFAIDPKTLSWDWWQAGYQIALIRGAGNRLLAASLDDGVLAGPKVPPAPAPPADASTH
jgi:photosystem II stability/assembly factor-like uncharacterized protein